MPSKNYIFKIYNNINILLKMVSICYNQILLIFVISTYLYNSERKTHVAHMLHKVIRMEYYLVEISRPINGLRSIRDVIRAWEY